jgi:D-glycero-alpha-D-manno-heptose-7-phosphate kinase
MTSDPRPIDAVAPLRISFVGGGTDFPHWYREHGGAVLSATIDHAVRVRLTPRDDREVIVRSLDLDELVRYHLDEQPVYDGVMDLAKAAIERVGVPTGLELQIASEAPPGSGLGGSSALVTAVVAALAMLDDRALDAHELAAISYAIEREDLGISGGWQDQYAAAFGGLNLLEFGEQGVKVAPVAIGAETRRTLERNLLLCYTGYVRRHVGLIDRQIAFSREGREDTRLGLKQLQEMAYVMRDALEAGDPDTVGLMLRSAFEAKRLMNPHIAEDTPIEAMLGAAQDAGAAGGKICGAGGGGYLLVYADPDVQPAVRRGLERLGGQMATMRLHPDGVRAYRGEAIWAPVR